MRCYKCLKQVPDKSEECPFCGQVLVPSLKKAKAKEAVEPSADSPPAEIRMKEYHMGDVIEDRYEVREEMGKGVVGTLYKVRDKKEKKTIALKMVNPNILMAGGPKNFLKGMKKIQALDHKHLVKIFDFNESEGAPYYTMEYLEGLSLKKLLAVRMSGKKFFSLEETEPIVLPVCSALSYLHKNKIVHILLKPENILILSSSVKLTDSGSAALLSASEIISNQLTLGDPYYYLAPEFITSGGKANPQADIYSLGVIIYQMMTGAIPKGAYKPPSEINENVPSDIDGFLEKALDHDPEQRHESIEAFKKGFMLILGKEAPPEEVEEEAREEKVEEVREEEVRKVEKVPEKVAVKIEEPPPVPPPPKEVVEEKPQVFVASPGMKEALQKETAPSVPPPIPPPPPPVTRAPVQERPLPDMELPPRAAELRIPRIEPAREEKPIPAVEPPRPKTGMKAVIAIAVGLIVLGVLGVGAYSIFFKEKKAPVVERNREVKAKAPQAAPKEEKKEEARKAEEERAKKEAEEARRKSEEAREAREKKKEAVKLAAAPKPEAPTSPCPDGMAYVPPGDFLFGSSPDDPMRDFSEKKNEGIYLAGFCIDIYEFPNRKGSSPMKNVSWDAARSKCDDEGKRLCTEEEWEKVCKGKKNLRFPYGNQWNPDKCNTQNASGEKRTPASSGSFASCRSDFGAYDMSGNIREWTATNFSATLEDKVVRGGSWASPDWASRCAYRYNALSNIKDNETGFRCCK